MGYETMRAELRRYYEDKANDNAEAFCVRVLPKLDALYTPGMSAAQMKALQYRVIADEMEPVIFSTNPFYFETGAIPAHSDGARDFHGKRHAGGWTYWKNSHYFAEQNPELWKLRCAQGAERLYLICGPYCDTSQHFNFNYKPVMAHGLRGVYEKAKSLLDGADESQREYLETTCTGLLAVKTISEKFAAAAAERLKDVSDPAEAAYLRRIADSAAYSPWEAPRTFYEALNTLAFLRTSVGLLEGVGFNTFGRPDVMLYPFYQADIREGRLTPDEAYDLVTRFLLAFDCHYDHDMKMVGYADHELENTYTIGGCDEEGRPVWNELTAMFLRATREEKIIIPKIKCRFSRNSPREYLDAIDEDVINGTSSILYQNDDASIPALMRCGKTFAEASDYILSGCWGLFGNGNEKPDNGNYVNLLKPFEFSIHRRFDLIEKVGIDFKPIDGAESFDEVYSITLSNFDKLFRERHRMSVEGKGVWSKVDQLTIYSSVLESCLDKKRDFTAGGAKYQDDQYMLVGFPNIVDSLLAIKTLCFDEKKVPLDTLLAAVRTNWEGYEDLRRDCLRCHCWGDHSAESNALAARLNHDLYQLADQLPPPIWSDGTPNGGKTQIGHLTYTEIRFWAENTLATPDGRHHGEYFSQGLTPSRLHDIRSVTDVVGSLSALDGSEMAANSVVNIILPSVKTGKMDLDICAAFLYACANTALQSLQLNCTSKEELLDAQKHPEKYPDLIIRVCGFSARFTALSPEWQKEVLSRNFYD